MHRIPLVFDDLAEDQNFLNTQIAWSYTEFLMQYSTRNIPHACFVVREGITIILSTTYMALLSSALHIVEVCWDGVWKGFVETKLKIMGLNNINFFPLQDFREPLIYWFKSCSSRDDYSIQKSSNLCDHRCPIFFKNT